MSLRNDPVDVTRMSAVRAFPEMTPPSILPSDSSFHHASEIAGSKINCRASFRSMAPVQSCIHKGPALGFTICCCCHLEILNGFEPRSPHFHFALGPAVTSDLGHSHSLTKSSKVFLLRREMTSISFCANLCDPDSSAPFHDISGTWCNGEAWLQRRVGIKRPQGSKSSPPCLDPRHEGE